MRERIRTGENRDPDVDRDPDAEKGAIEGDRPGQEQQGNENTPALDEQGLPADATAIAEDVIGANEDQSQG